MVTVHDQYGHIVNGKSEKPAQGAPQVRRQWIAPTWERLETPMEITMYVAQR